MVDTIRDNLISVVSVVVVAVAAVVDVVLVVRVVAIRRAQPPVGDNHKFILQPTLRRIVALFVRVPPSPN